MGVYALYTAHMEYHAAETELTLVFGETKRLLKMLEILVTFLSLKVIQNVGFSSLQNQSCEKFSIVKGFPSGLRSWLRLQEPSFLSWRLHGKSRKIYLALNVLSFRIPSGESYGLGKAP